MPTPIDLAFVALFTIGVMALQMLVLWPRFERAANPDDEIVEFRRDRRKSV